MEAELAKQVAVQYCMQLAKWAPTIPRPLLVLRHNEALVLESHKLATQIQRLVHDHVARIDVGTGTMQDTKTPAQAPPQPPRPRKQPPRQRVFIRKGAKYQEPMSLSLLRRYDEDWKIVMACIQASGQAMEFLRRLRLPDDILVLPDVQKDVGIGVAHFLDSRPYDWETFYNALQDVCPHAADKVDDFCGRNIE
jgi:hypothetical protein